MRPSASSRTTAATPTVAKSPTLRSSFCVGAAGARGRRGMRISVRTSVGSMAVVNVSRKKSRAGDRSRSPAAARGRRCVGAARRGATAGQSDAGSAWATEPPIVPQLRTCGSPIAAGHVVEQRVAVADDRRPRGSGGGSPGRRCARSSSVSTMPSSPVDVAEVDEERRLGEPELDQRDEAVAAGQELGLALAVLEDPRAPRRGRPGGRSRTGRGSSRCQPSSPLARAWGPVLVRRGQA